MLVRSFTPNGVSGVIIKSTIRLRVQKVLGNKAVISVYFPHLGATCEQRLGAGEAVRFPISDSAEVKVIVIQIWANKVRLGFEPYKKDGPEIVGKRAIQACPIVPESF